MTLHTSFLTRLPKALTTFQRHSHRCETLLSPPHNHTFSPIRFSHKPLKCWQCGIQRKNIGELFCDQCSHIQAPTQKDNYFKVFEINENFFVDQKKLTAKYRELQSLLHPDKFSTKSDTEKNISEEFSSLVNRAYKTLQAPLKRAIHLLYLKGGSIEEDTKVEDPQFLMEIMELNEEVESADTEEKLKALKQKNDKQLAHITKEIQAQFDANQIAQAKKSIIKMKYYYSVGVHINTLMREKGIVE